MGQAKRHFVLPSLLGLALILGVGYAAAQAYPPGDSASAPPSSTVSGTLVSQDATSISIRTDDGREMRLTLDAGLSVPANLKAGDRVTVEYVAPSSGGFQATSVYVDSPAGTNQPASEASAMQQEESLPQTASPLPLLALVGTVLLGVGAALWIRSRQTA